LAIYTWFGKRDIFTVSMSNKRIKYRYKKFYTFLSLGFIESAVSLPEEESELEFLGLQGIRDDFFLSFFASSATLSSLLDDGDSIQSGILTLALLGGPICSAASLSSSLDGDNCIQLYFSLIALLGRGMDSSASSGLLTKVEFCFAECAFSLGSVTM